MWWQVKLNVGRVVSVSCVLEKWLIDFGVFWVSSSGHKLDVAQVTWYYFLVITFHSLPTAVCCCLFIYFEMLSLVKPLQTDWKQGEFVLSSVKTKALIPLPVHALLSLPCSYQLVCVETR